GVLGVQAGHRQGRHGLWRLQAAGHARGLGWLAGAALDHSSVVAGGRRVGHHHSQEPWWFQRHSPALWTLSGDSGVDCHYLGGLDYWDVSEVCGVLGSLVVYWTIIRTRGGCSYIRAAVWGALDSMDCRSTASVRTRV